MRTSKDRFTASDDIRTEDHRDYFVVGVPEKMNVLNFENISKSVEKAIAQGHSRIVFNLSRTIFIDSSGLGVFTTTLTKLNAISGKVFITSPSSTLYKLLETNGILKVVAVIDDPNDIPVPRGTAIEVSENGFYVLFKLPQQFNVELVATLRNRFAEALEKGYIHFVFDFSGNRFITSVGIGILMKLREKLRSLQGEIYLFGLCPEVRSLLQTANLFKVITEHSSLDEIDRILI